MTTKKQSKPVPKKNSVMVFDHARVDASHCLTDGLFRPLSRAPKKEPLDVVHVYMGYTMRWLNYCKLNIVDQSVFLAIHRMAAENGRLETVGNQHESPTMLQVRAALKLEKDAAKSDCLVLDTSLYEIAKVMGINDCNDNLKMIKNSLFKLACVNFVIYKGEDIGDAFFQTNLFSRLAGSDGQIHLGINPMLCKALIGGQSTFINMGEQRRLDSHITKRLHVWLSSWLQTNGSKKIALDKLIPHVWGEEYEDAALRKRRYALRKALAELNTLEGWKSTESGGMVLISREGL